MNGYGYVPYPVDGASPPQTAEDPSVVYGHVPSAPSGCPYGRIGGAPAASHDLGSGQLGNGGAPGVSHSAPMTSPSVGLSFFPASQSSPGPIRSRGPSAPASDDGVALPLEWWERLGDRAAQWRWLSVLLQVRAVISWACLLFLGLLLVLSPLARMSLGAWFGCLWIVATWFWLARAKTVSWAVVSGVFAASILWSGVVAWVSFRLITAAGVVVGDGAASVVAARVVEELGKIAPLGLIALLAPGRTRRLLIQDWLLLGVAAGAGFMAAEETARRIAFIAGKTPGLMLHRVLCPPDSSKLLECLDLTTFGPWSFLGTDRDPGTTGGVVYAGHAVITALIVVSIGLARHLWWRARGVGGVGAWVLRCVSASLPVGVLWVGIVDHMVFNSTGGPGRGGGALWSETRGQVPWSGVGLTSALTGGGQGRGALLLVLLAVAWVLDTRLLRVGGYTFLIEGDDGDGRWGPWKRRLLSGLPAHAGGRLIADLVDLVATAGIEARWALLALREAAATRNPRLLGRAAGNLRRVRDVVARTVLDPGPGRWVVRAMSVVVLAAGAGVLLMVPSVVRDLAHRAHGALWESWYVGVLDSLGTFWDSLSFDEKVLVVMAAGAVVVLSGGTLGLAFNVGMGVVTVMGAAHGAADLARDPKGTVIRYLTTRTPAEMALDAAGAALTVVGGGATAMTSGRAARALSRQTRYEVRMWRADPAAWRDYHHAHLKHFGGEERGSIPVSALDPRGGNHFPNLRRVAPGTSEGGPGLWGPGRNFGSPRSQVYEEYATGVPIEHSYYVNGVEFDAFDGRTLIDAKGQGYAEIIQGDWSTKEPDGLLESARRQVAAVRATGHNTPIQWRIAEPETLETLQRLQQRGRFPAQIDLVLLPAP